ncbi:translin-associated protein X-like [Lolium rigidum]|uniref:translin-associated protein X-like n=1 Tax=Lolium rigidum TaxID=89674 RepID=UPI001F5C8B00|nr:translin-associated protein X-like [Lolium rigidum]
MSAALSPASTAGPPPKRFRTMATDAAPPPASAGCSAMKAEFARHTDYLNAHPLLGPWIKPLLDSFKVFASFKSNVTIRISRNNKEEVLSKAENDLAAVVNQHIGKLVKELQGTDFWKLRRAYTFGVQEYIEAATFCRFCKTGTLLSLDEINDSLLALSDKSVEPLQINVLDYILGVADLSGELMRLAIGRISDEEVEYAKDICSFVRDIYRELTLLVPLMDDNNEMKKKMEVMLQSVVKIENACFGVHVRGSEYIPMLGSSAKPDYAFFGGADYD